MYDILIKNGKVIDGTGSDAYAADVAVKDGVIAAVGRLEGAEAEQVIDAAGKLVTPGMIDMHSHADVGSWAYPEMESMLGQGVTSCFSGHCGMGVAPVYDWWIENGVESLAVNQLIPPILGGSYMPGFNRTVETLAVREAVKIPVVANGDIFDAEAALRCEKRTGAELLMIGRSAFGNPWVFAQVQAALDGREVPALPPLSERMDTAMRQFELAREDKGEYIACLEARKHLAWYLRGVPYSGYYKEKISSISTVEDVQRLAAGIRRDLR